MKRQRPALFFSTVTPLLASGAQRWPPSLQAAVAHFGFLVTVETRTVAHLGTSPRTLAICAFSLLDGLRSALALATREMAATANTAMNAAWRICSPYPGDRPVGDFSTDVREGSRQRQKNGPCTRSRDVTPRRVRCDWLGPGLPASHVGYRLRLLPSGPDLVRRPTLRRTWPSTPPAAARPRGPVPCQGIQLRLSGLRITGHR